MVTRTATAEKTEKRKFTCFDEEIVIVQAESPAGADEEIFSNLIVEGTLEAIGAKRIESTPRESVRAEDTKLEPNTVCTLIVGDHMMVAGATFLVGGEEINKEDFLAWRKNNVRFWTYRHNTRLTYVGGQRVGLSRPD